MSNAPARTCKTCVYRRIFKIEFKCTSMKSPNYNMRVEKNQTCDRYQLKTEKQESADERRLDRTLIYGKDSK